MLTRSAAREEHKYDFVHSTRKYTLSLVLGFYYGFHFDGSNDSRLIDNAALNLTLCERTDHMWKNRSA